MKTAAALVAATLLLQACAGRPAGAPQAVPEIFQHEYEFTGVFDGREISGTVWFVDSPLQSRMEYMISSDVGLCRGELRHLNTSWVRLGCGGILMDFARNGRVLERANASLRTTRPVTRQECRFWQLNERGQRICTQWGTVTVDVPVTQRGSLEILRVGDVTGG